MNTKFLSKKRQAFTLLEVMLALFLTAILLLYLFDVFKKTTLQNLAISETDASIFSLERSEMRLSHLFSSIPEGTKGKPSLFYTINNEGLMFIFDHGIDEDPLFSGTIRAHLSLSHKRFSLTLLPLDEDSKMRKEELLYPIQSLAFSFFDLETKSWISDWKKDKKALPHLVRIKVVLDESLNTPYEFAFQLTSSQTPVIYK